MVHYSPPFFTPFMDAYRNLVYDDTWNGRFRARVFVFLADAFVVQLATAVKCQRSVRNAMLSIHLITKPLSPPWNDSARNLPRYLVESASSVHFSIFTDRTQPTHLHPCTIHPVYSHASTPVLSHLNKMRIFYSLFSRYGMHQDIPRPNLFHAFFTPNRLSSAMFRFLRRWIPGIPCIQTVTATPECDADIDRLNGVDGIITLSRVTEHRIAQRIHRPIWMINPGVPDVDPLPRDQIQACRSRYVADTALLVLYPGDLFFSKCTSDLLQIADMMRLRFPGSRLIVSNRVKTTEDTQTAIDLCHSGYPVIAVADASESMPVLLSAADLVIFPIRSMHGKMDIPLVLIEAMAHGKPVIVSDFGPLKEVGETGGTIVYPCIDAHIGIDRIHELLQSREQLSLLGGRARDVYERRFTARRMAMQTEVVYREFAHEG
ncbi:glycosyltransferase family 4 protein [bacterium]|nr:glycosyltransferase family 4 protein [candidate division CSSED10-310 bacterium]